MSPTLEGRYFVTLRFLEFGQCPDKFVQQISNFLFCDVKFIFQELGLGFQDVRNEKL